MINPYRAAIKSFRDSLLLIEKEGRKGSPEWHWVNGLLRLSQGIKHDRDVEMERQRGYARTYSPRKPRTSHSESDRLGLEASRFPVALSNKEGRH